MLENSPTEGQTAARRPLQFEAVEKIVPVWWVTSIAGVGGKRRKRKCNPHRRRDEMHKDVSRVSGFLLALIVLNFYTADAVLAQGPCAQIRAACEQAGFVRGGGRTGNGIQVDCVRPIMAGTSQRPKASKPLPKVDAQLITACKATNPNFGQARAPAAGPDSGQPRPSVPKDE
jgi:hypothetical protein